MAFKEIFDDEVPDSIFREMIRRNAFMLILVSAISVALSVFLYFSVLENRYCIKAKFNLKHSTEVLSSEAKCHQHLIRILKNDKIRKHLVEKYHLLEVYKIDTSDPYYQIKLDKKLFDDLKVEEQSDGTILVSFVNENPQKSIEVITELISFGIKEMALSHTHKDLVPNFVFMTKDFDAEIVHPRFLSILFMITIPVLLSCIIFIAIKEKLYMNLNLDDH